MRFLSFILIFLSISVLVKGQSPHGSDFDLDCSSCHQEDTWKVNILKVKFDHSQTGFKLVGQHKTVNCRSCHESLVFKDAAKNTTCFSCHKDVHQNSVGFDCAKCHSPETWSVKNINELHQMSRFPLLGMHMNADCISCHKQFSSLNFTPSGIACYDCHAKEFKSTVNPNHVASGFSTDCQDCHSITASNWAAGTLSIGRRGSPRKLNVPGEEKEKVYYKLLEPELVHDSKILVVGGGDSAIESALLLADEHNEVTISYRSASFSRLKPRNLQKITDANLSKKIKIVFNSGVKEIKDTKVILTKNGSNSDIEIKNDLVYIFAGGELPTQFLEKIGIQISKKFGEVVLKH